MSAHGREIFEETGGRLGALTVPNFRYFWIASLISQAGNWMQQVAISWLLLEMTNSAFYLGLQGLFLAIPFIVSSMVAGAVADRMNRRVLLMLTQFTLLILAFAQAFVVHLGVIQVWHIYLFSTLSWICSGFDTAARQSILPGIVPRKHLSSGIALFSTLHRTTAVVGPVLGGVTIASFGVVAALYINAATFLLPVLALAVMHTSATQAGHRQALGRAVVEGLRHARAERGIWALLALQTSASIFANYTALLPIYARDILEIGPQGLGMLHSAVGVGSLAGVIAILALNNTSHRWRWIIAGSLAFPCLVAAFGVSTNVFLSLAFLFGTGLVDMIVSTMRTTLLQLEVDDRFRGRIMSLNSIANRGVSPLGNLQAGTLATFMGAPAAIALGALVALGAAVAIGATASPVAAEALPREREAL
jgi:MFS family permease